MSHSQHPLPNTGQSVRIYPEWIPWEDGHPTADKFEVIDTADERGRGLRARVAFGTDAFVVRLSGAVVGHATLDTIQILPKLHMSDSWLARFLLHSCEPNLAINTADMTVRAVTPIQPGDYLTIDYTATEDMLASQFACQCGARGCRGWMLGRLEEPTEEGRAFLEAWERGTQD